MDTFYIYSSTFDHGKYRDVSINWQSRRTQLVQKMWCRDPSGRDVLGSKRCPYIFVIIFSGMNEKGKV